MAFVYMLTHSYNEVPRATFVESDLEPADFERLVVYIEFKSADLDGSYTVDQEEVAEVLCQLYGCSLVSNADHPQVHEVNQYLNWEKYCGHAEEIEAIKEFERDDLNLMLEFYIERYKESRLSNAK